MIRAIRLPVHAGPPPRRFAALLAALGVLFACHAAQAEEATRPAGPLEVTACAVPLDGQHQTLNQLGALRYRGGIQISSADPSFGGLSALSVSPDGASFSAISDLGYWVRGNLVYDASGDLAGVGGTEMGPLLDPRGVPTVGKTRGDAESMAPDGRGGTFVGFERNHRLWRYKTLQGPAVEVEAPDGLADAPDNGGLEALARLNDGRTLALSESIAADGGTRGWVGTPGDWSPLTLAIGDGFAATDAVSLPDGDVLVVERRFPPIGVRLVRVAAGAIAPGAVLEGSELARLEGSYTVDNMEGIAVRQGRYGETLIYLLSDDNFNAVQRTLLMMFELRP